MQIALNTILLVSESAQGVTYEQSNVEYAKNAAIHRHNTVRGMVALAVPSVADEDDSIPLALLDVSGGTSI